MSSLNLHAHTAEGTVHVCAVHRGPKDETPLQLISSQELARLHQVEADHQALLKSLAATQQRPCSNS